MSLIPRDVRNVGYAALAASLFGTACAKKDIEVRNDYATEAYTDGNGRKQAYFGVETPRGDTVLVPTGSLDSARNLARRVHGGDRIKIEDGRVTITRPNPYGEIPFGRNLVVRGYDRDELRDFNNPARVNDVAATVDAEFTAGNVNERYVINITAQSREEAQRTVRNLQRYNVLRITEQNERARRGERGQRVLVKPTENGVELFVPAYRLAWSDLFEYDVPERVPRQRGRITPTEIYEPWRPQPARADSAQRTARSRQDTTRVAPQQQRHDSARTAQDTTHDSLRYRVGGLEGRVDSLGGIILADSSWRNYVGRRLVTDSTNIERNRAAIDSTDQRARNATARLDSVATQARTATAKADSALAGQRRRRN